MSGNTTTSDPAAASVEMVDLAPDEIFFGRASEPAPETDYISIGRLGHVIFRRGDDVTKWVPSTTQVITLDTARTIARMQKYYETEPTDTTEVERPDWPEVDATQVSVPTYNVVTKPARNPDDYKEDTLGLFKTWSWPSTGEPHSAAGASGDTDTASALGKKRRRGFLGLAFPSRN